MDIELRGGRSHGKKLTIDGQPLTWLMPVRHEISVFCTDVLYEPMDAEVYTCTGRHDRNNRLIYEYTGRY